ncbi:kinase-like domain-containing protein, partial [Mycena galopus ATCC 62051]
LFREALLWHYLRHPNIAIFLGVDSVTFESPAMVSPWLAQGNLDKYMVQHTPASSYAIKMLCGIFSGLQYMHSRDVIHGDLCARNILIHSDGRPRLTDFGLTEIELEGAPSGAAKSAGSTRWMAPELFCSPYQRTKASDIWAFGCVCCEVNPISTLFSNIELSFEIALDRGTETMEPPRFQLPCHFRLESARRRRACGVHGGRRIR